MQQRQPEKQCKKCHEWLPYSNFHMDRRLKDGLYPFCKKCKKDIDKKRYSSERNRYRYLRREYGITSSEYNRMLAEQGGVCAICKLPESSIDRRTGNVRRLAVDHDHNTGDVRALLCNFCNTALGHMNEDPERIRSLLCYAEWCQTREPNRKIIQLSMIEPDQIQQ